MIEQHVEIIEDARFAPAAGRAKRVEIEAFPADGRGIQKRSNVLVETIEPRTDRLADVRRGTRAARTLDEIPDRLGEKQRVAFALRVQLFGGSFGRRMHARSDAVHVLARKRAERYRRACAVGLEPPYAL